jgi:hypothetical protein
MSDASVDIANEKPVAGWLHLAFPSRLAMQNPISRKLINVVRSPSYVVELTTTD